MVHKVSREKLWGKVHANMALDVDRLSEPSLDEEEPEHGKQQAETQQPFFEALDDLNLPLRRFTLEAGNQFLFVLASATMFAAASGFLFGHAVRWMLV